MTTDQQESTIFEQIAQALVLHGGDGVKQMLELVYNAVMKLERNHALGAEPYQRTEDRQGYANGFKDKALNTRMGTLELKVPQVRGLDFYPKCLDKGSRSERALKAAIAEMYVKGVSTRKVEAITKELCGLDVTATQVSRATKELDEEFEQFRNRSLGEYPYVYLDGTYFKVRYQGSVISMACLLAYGVDPEGKRHILGVSMSLSEAEVHWREFLTSLQLRGLRGVKLIISDDHAGLRNAREAIFPAVLWQRCQFHLSQNAQAYAHKRELRASIASAMRTIFAAPKLEIARHLIKETAAQFEQEAPQFSKWLEENAEEGLTVFHFPIAHQKRLRTTNSLERVNREIKRRVRVAVLFPNEASALRLVTGIVSEIHDEWITGKAYLNMTEDEATEEKAA